MPIYYDKIHNVSNRITVGEINNFILYINEQTTGKIKLNRLGVVKISVYAGEGPVPHFHIEGKDFSCCVCIFDNRYFDHGTHQDTLNRKQLKELDSFMRDKSSIDDKFTNWEYIKNVWYINNVKSKDSITILKFKYQYNNIPQPDYTKLDGYKRN